MDIYTAIVFYVSQNIAQADELLHHIQAQEHGGVGINRQGGF